MSKNNNPANTLSKVVWKYGLVCSLAVSGKPAIAAGIIDIGGLLDRAAIACAKRDDAQLADVGRQLEGIIGAYPDLPQEQAYVRKLVEDFRQGNCYLPKHSDPEGNGSQHITKEGDTRLDGATRLQASVGYGSNINLGVRNQTLTLDGFKEPLLLAESSRAKEDAFTDVLLSHEHQFEAVPALKAAATYNQRDYKDNSEFSYKALELNLQYKAKDEKNYTLGRQNTWIEGDLWQESSQVKVLTPLPVGDGETSRLYWEASLNQDAYPRRPEYDATVARSNLRYQRVVSDSTLVQVKAEVAYDHAEDQRPGGDRKSHGVSVAALKVFDSGWQALAEVGVKKRYDSEPYSPELFSDKKRVQTLGQAGVRLRKPLRKGLWLDISYVQNAQGDKNIPLFDVETNRSGSVGIEYRW